mgnify:FL=1
MTQEESVPALAIIHLVSLLISMPLAMVDPKNVLNMEKSVFYENAVNAMRNASFKCDGPINGD